MTCENEKGGKTYSLKKLLEQYFFIIPEYQRDYAQGRDNERDVHVLDMFIKEITKVLSSKSSEEQGFHLDYVYGDVVEKNGVELFYPVDGQQRLTTLFLFYVYCYQTEKEKEFLSKLKYNIRPTSNKLIRGLVSNGFKEPNPSSSDWRQWINLCREISKDPTAVALLSAYRKIEKEMKSVEEKELKARLEEISFEVVDTKEHKLQRSIFWKMNARGRALTQSEVFKAAFFSEDKSARTFNDFVENLFGWIHEENKDYQVIDNTVMSIVNIIFEGFGEIEHQTNSPDGFDFWKSTYISKDEYLKYEFKRKEINQIFSAFNSMEKPFDLFDSSIPEYVKKEIKDRIQNRLVNNIDLNQKIRVRALFFSYLIALPINSEHLNDWMRDWMRFCTNIIWNASETESALKLIYQLLSKAKDILRYLASQESEKVSALLQYEEERIKASAILNKEIGKNDIEEAENTAFAGGRIDFLYYNAAGKVDWDNFIKRRYNFYTWFDDEGVKKDYREAIITAYIKLSPWDWNELYFNTSKDHWRGTIFGGIHDKVFKEGYLKIVDGLLSSSNLCSIDFRNGENQRSDVIRKSLLDNTWFIKWMTDPDKKDYQIIWQHSECPFFHVARKSTYIYWDAGGWKNDSNDQAKEVNKFFWLLRKDGVMLNDGFWCLIDDNGNNITKEASSKTYKYANSKYDEHHHLLSIINPWGYNGLLPFKYKGVEFFLLPQGIILLSRIEDTTGLWENKDRWIYENFWNNLLSKDELLGKLNKIVEIKGISEK